MKLGLKYLSVILVLMSVYGTCQTRAKKVKEVFDSKNYQLTIDEINSIQNSEINFDSILYIKAYSQIKLNQIKEAQITLS